MATGIAALEEAFRGRGMAAAGHRARTLIPAEEHETVLLPADLIKEDGSLDVYDDVLNLFRPTYKKNRPSIQCAGWVGYIPLNDAYALEVSTRVPVGNLERLMGMAAGYTPEVLRKYIRLFGHAEDRPEALFDVLADQMLAAFDRIWESGLLKTYDRVIRIGNSPSGRIMPFETEWLTAKAGRPTAMSSSFHRTPDFGPNRLLRHAFEKLLARYIGIQDQKQRARTLRLRKAVARLGDVRRASPSDLTPQAIAGYIRQASPQIAGSRRCQSGGRLRCQIHGAPDHGPACRPAAEPSAGGAMRIDRQLRGFQRNGQSRGVRHRG